MYDSITIKESVFPKTFWPDMSDPLQVGRSRKEKGDQQEGESQIGVLLL